MDEDIDQPSLIKYRKMRNEFFVKKEMVFVSENEQFTGLLPLVGMPHFNSSASLTPKDSQAKKRLL
jgi:hypothetical protein